MTFIEYIHENHEKFIIRFNTYIINHYITFSSASLSRIRFQIMNSNEDPIAGINFMYCENELCISSLSVDDEYRGQSVGTFLIFLGLQIVYEYSILMGLSGMKICVSLDDMSDGARKVDNIYRFCGLHYDKIYTNEPEMSSSLIHAIRICSKYLKSKIEKVDGSRSSIFNKCR